MTTNYNIEQYNRGTNIKNYFLDNIYKLLNNRIVQKDMSKRGQDMSTDQLLDAV